MTEQVLRPKPTTKEEIVNFPVKAGWSWARDKGASWVVVHIIESGNLGVDSYEKSFVIFGQNGDIRPCDFNEYVAEPIPYPGDYPK